VCLACNNISYGNGYSDVCVLQDSAFFSRPFGRNFLGVSR
jgi:hypothetical protein